ncbi:MAG: retention module-containing protein [Halioglobus sp.]
MDPVAIATVVAVTGNAYARNADGELREIRPGDVLLEGETIVTPDGGTVELSLSDGSPMVVDVPELTLTTDMVADLAPGADESAVGDETIDAVLAALESGEDLGDVLAATAAGPGSGGPAGAGHSFIRLGRIVEGTDEFSGVVGTLAAESELTIDQNLSPVDAIDDSAQTDAGEPVTIVVEDNDIFFEGEDVISITQPENGTAVLNDDDTVTYTPNEGFFGEDKFTYTAVGPDGTQRDSAEVTVDVAPPPPEDPKEPMEEPPVINIGDDVVIEGGTASVTVTLSKAWDEAVTVKFETADDTATVSGGDYDPATGTITFQPGQTELEVNVTTNEDNFDEPTEFLNVNLSDPINATIGDGQGQVEIIDIYEEPTITIGDQTVTEGETAVVTVTLSRAVEEPVTVDFVTADGTAIEFEGDYLGTEGTLTFAPGQTTLTVTVVTLEDDLVESTEDEFVMLSNADNAVIADPEGIVRIIDNDEPPVVQTNNPPDAVNDGFSTEVNTPVSGNVLPNDSDPDNDPLTVTGNTQPANGTVTVNPDGSFTYTPNENFDGSDSFQYTITDGEGGSDTATVNIVVTDEPVDLLPTVRGIQSEFPEAQLPGGSAENPAALTKDGVFTVTAGDGLDTLVINGVEVIADGAVTGTNVVTDTGVQVTITSVTPGADGIYEVAYTATLLDRFQHDADSDEKLVAFTIEVTDTDGDSASAVRSASIIDDSPTAQSDANVIPAEEYGPVGGNVVTNDTLGADGAEVVGVASGDTGEALDDPGTLGTIAGLYGDLELSADGTYTYTRSEDAPGDVEDVFTYTIKDADGDLSSTTLTISIGDAPVTLDLPVEGEDGTAVDESGLPARDVGDGPEPEGSDAASPSETTAGTFFYTAPDGPAVVTIDGTAVTSAGQTFAGTAGTLTIISVNAGAIEYSYTLADNTAGDASSDSFAVSVTDQDGDNATDTLTISIGDDAVTANDDVDAVASDSESTTGNVIVGAGPSGTDVVGADNAVVVSAVSGSTNATLDDPTTIVGTITGTYGELILGSDGSYTYTLFEGTTPGEVQDVFTYTLKDGDGDLDYATLTIEINDSGVTVSVPDAGGETTTVYEAGLDADTVDRAGEPAGTDEAKSLGTTDTESVDGTFTYVVGDTPAEIYIEGVLVNTAGLPQTFTNGDGKGELTITAAGGGTVSYTYTLLDNTGPATDSDSFDIRVEDADDEFAEDILTISIIDNAPEANADVDVLSSSETATSGNVIDGVGTDAQDYVGADNATVVGVVKGDTTDDQSANIGAWIDGDYGRLKLNGDGSYDYELFEGTPPGDVDDVFTYTLKEGAGGDNDTATTTLTIEINDEGVTVTLPPETGEGSVIVDEAGLPVRDFGEPEPAGSGEGADDIPDNDNSEKVLDGSFTYTAPDVPVDIVIDGVTVVENGSLVIVGDANVIETSKGTLTITGIETGTETVTYTYVLKDNVAHDTGDIEDTRDRFEVTVTDTDGETAVGDLVINIIDDEPSMGEVSNGSDTVVDNTAVGGFEAEAEGQLLDFFGGADAFATLDINLDSGRYSQLGEIQWDGDTAIFTGTTDGVTPAFTLALDVNGEYIFTLLQDIPPTPDEVSLLGAIDPGAPGVYTYTSESGGDVVVTGNAEGDPNPSKQGLGSGGDNNVGGPEALNFAFDTDVTGVMEFGLFVVNEGTVSIGIDANTDGMLTVEEILGSKDVSKSDGLVSFDIGDTVTDNIMLQWDPGKGKVTSISFERDIAPLDEILDFSIDGVDGDGDLVSTDLTITVDDPRNDAPLSGAAIDSAITGMDYVTSSGLSGRTDANGLFSYRGGDMITFTVGAIVIGTFPAEALADGKVFLQEIAGVGLSDLNNEYVENMAVFLQSLDNDGDAYNGIVINDGIHTAFSDENFDLAAVSEGELQNILIDNGYTPVTEGDAMQHVKDMIMEHAGVTEFEEHVDDGVALLATGDDDVFAFALNEDGESGSDVSITGFGEAGTDALDLRDLLVGEEADGADLTSFLNVSFDGANTVIEVSSSGGFAEGSDGAANVDQTITLEGVDLVGTDELSTVIQNMLESGQLITD